MGTFFQELLHVGVYKRSQGRITRQVTFAAIALTVAIGLLRLSSMLVDWDPIIRAMPARVTCMTKDGRIGADAKITLTGTAGSATVAAQAGEPLAKLAESIDAHRKTTGVLASMLEGKLVLSSAIRDETGFIRLAAPSGSLQIEGPGPDGVARGRNAVNLGLRFLIPGVLLIVGVWGTYRAVNVPGFADFLIAVEAEMNKVSWPTRGELFRASMVVLILIFALAFALFGCDMFWKVLLSKVLHIL